MVFFTCEHCGESIKKPRVAKHYETVCRNRKISVTCVDCLKVFVGSEYDSHVKCISEEDRYSALGLDSKPTLNKGDKKQELWNSCVERCLENPNLTKAELKLLQEISKHPNVPRKKVKFINFMKNSFRPQADAAPRLFDLIEAEFMKSKETDENKNDSNGTMEVDSKKEDDNAKSSKNKKHATPETNGTEKQSSENGEMSSKKKSKKRKMEEEINESVDELTKKEKKKKKKRESAATSEGTDVHLHMNGFDNDTSKGFEFDWTKVIVDSIKTHGSNNIIPYTKLFELTKEKYCKALFIYHINKISNISIEGDKVELI